MSLYNYDYHYDYYTTYSKQSTITAAISPYFKINRRRPDSSWQSSSSNLVRTAEQEEEKAQRTRTTRSTSCAEITTNTPKTIRLVWTPVRDGPRMNHHQTNATADDNRVFLPRYNYQNSQIFLQQVFQNDSFYRSIRNQIRSHHHLHGRRHGREARCRFTTNPFSSHLPHAMQQLYRCWSFWQILQQQQQEHDDEQEPIQPVLLYPRRHRHDFFKPLPTTPTNRTVSFVQSFVWLLQYAANVQLQEDDDDDDESTNNHHNTNVDQDDDDANVHVIAAVQPRPDQDGYALRPVDAEALRHIWHRVQASLLLFNNQQHENHNNDDDDDDDTCRWPRIAILNRARTRRLSQAAPLAKAIEKEMALLSSAAAAAASSLPRVSILYFEQATFAEQIDLLSRHDILVSPHGAQLTALPWLRKDGTLVEIFPSRYCLPYFFGSLAQSSGIRHAYVPLDPDAHCRFLNDGRDAARNVPRLCLHKNVTLWVQTVMVPVVQEWRQRRYDNQRYHDYKTSNHTTCVGLE